MTRYRTVFIPPALRPVLDSFLRTHPEQPFSALCRGLLIGFLYNRGYAVAPEKETHHDATDA